MNCKNRWTLDFLFSNFPSSFIFNEYELSRAKIKFNQEKSLLPLTQLNIFRRKMNRQLTREQDTILNTVRNLGNIIYDYKQNNDGHRAALLLTDSYYNDLSTTLNSHILSIKSTVTFLDETNKEIQELSGTNDLSDDKSKSKNLYRSILGNCSQKDCRGYITSRGGKCIMCNQHYCIKCLTGISFANDPSHVCNESDMLTVAVMRNECRPCPQCKVLIHRYEGCPQMFCTNCHTGFDWNTGKVLKQLHNPHLTEWLMSNGNNANNNNADCDVVNLASINSKIPSIKINTIKKYYDSAEHFRTWVIPNLQHDYQNSYEDLREKYINKHVNEEEWVQEIKIIRKREIKNNEIVQVLDLFTNACMDILLQYQHNSFDDVVLSDQLENLKIIVNEKLGTIEKRLKVSCKKYYVV
jgi:hypothetical protein